jgi:hypothetical protein
MTEYLAARDHSLADKPPAVSAFGSSDQAPNVMWRVNIPPRHEDVPRVSSRNPQSVDVPQSTPPPTLAATAAVSPPFSGSAVKGAATPDMRSTPEDFVNAQAASGDEQSTTSSSLAPPALPNPPVFLPRTRSGRRAPPRSHPKIPHSPSGGGPASICSPTGTSVRRKSNQSPTAAHTMEQTTLNSPAPSVAGPSNPILTPLKTAPSLTETREEHLYRERGYFAAPHPPNELGRLTALRKSVESSGGAAYYDYLF